METFLVGGAVRDRLLGRPVVERDYVVVGATPDEMLRLGYRQVGRDFPVFLHPQTRCEHALARTGRKSDGTATAPLVHADRGVTLEQDLSRRDLTINALAETSGGRIIDYFGGLRDLEQHILRHVSPAFAEDPVRILRVARFMARYGPLGFRVADETLELMRAMVAEGRMDHLVPERVWQELVRALGEPQPTRFFETLRACGALAPILPELDRLWGVPQPKRWHPEIDTGVHTMMVVEMARRLSDDPAVVFAALIHDLGKGETPAEILPSHHGHEQRGVQLLEGICGRLRIPNRFCELARLVARYHGKIHHAEELKATTVLKILLAADAFRRPRRLQGLLLAAEADYRGRKGFEQRPYPQAERFRAWYRAAAAVNTAAVAKACRRPERIGEAIYRARVTAIQRAGAAAQPPPSAG